METVLTVDEKPTGTTCRTLVKLLELLQRPIVEKGDRAVLALPVENVRELFGS